MGTGHVIPILTLLFAGVGGMKATIDFPESKIPFSSCCVHLAKEQNCSIYIIANWFDGWYTLYDMV